MNMAHNIAVTSADYNNSQITQLCILLAFMSIGFFRASPALRRQRFKMLLVWIVLILALVAGYSYWPEFKNSKFYASLVPGTPIMQENGQMEFIKADDGHFYIDALVNGQNVRFMVDTGASDIVLNQKDAQKLGFDPQNLKYNRYFTTANGTTRGASVKIDSLKLGNFSLDGIYTSINEGQLENSLLGMSFLDKFSSYNVEGNKLILKP